jgi:predicted histidine transporter YuiF (NhaC family)
MNRKDLASVLTRFAGLYFGYLAATKILGLASAVLILSSVLGDIAKGISVGAKMALSTALPGAISCFITAGISYYLLRKGNWVIEFLSKDSANTSNEA